MARKILIIVATMFFIISCNKNGANKNVIQTSENQIINDEQQQSVSSLNREFLRSDFYTLNLYNEVNYNINKWGLTFFSDDTYEIRPMLAGDPPIIKGSYQIIDNKVLLKYINMPYGEYAEYKFDSILKENWELEYTTINNSLHFSEGLIGKGIIFARKNSKPKADEIRTIDGHDIIIVQENEDGFRLTSNAKVRIGPGTNFQHCVFEWINDYDGTTSTTEYLEEGKRIYIIGHSKNIDTINGLTGYWYYCMIPVYPDTGGEIIEPKTLKDNNGWIFGPLINIK